MIDVFRSDTKETSSKFGFDHRRLHPVCSLTTREEIELHNALMTNCVLFYYVNKCPSDLKGGTISSVTVHCFSHLEKLFFMKKENPALSK